MKRLYLTGVLWTVIAQASPAEEPPTPAASPAAVAVVKKPDGGTAPAPVFSEPTAVYFGGANPTLNTQEAAGVGITRQWEEKSYGAMVQTPGQDGAVQFKYGECLPTIVCAVLNVTDIELQPGETVSEH